MGAKVPDNDALPSNEVLEAERARDQRETEDVLAAFDRPRRGAARPVPSGGPGFVEYFGAEPGAGAAARRPREVPRLTPPPARRQAELATVVKGPSRRSSVPPWLFWAGASATMLGVGFTVALVTTTDPPSRSATPPTPSVSAARAPVSPLPTGRDEVPLPDPTIQSAPVSTAPAVTAAQPAAPPLPEARPRSERATPRPPIDTATVPTPAPAPAPRRPDDGPIRRL